MNHNEVRSILLNNPAVNKEYDCLSGTYKIKHEIIKLRLDQGFSQKDLVERIGSKRSAISPLEN